jgi:hypothetical protein
VGCVDAKPNKIRQSWGATSLPWLILTDREHKVTHEGFALEDLEAKLTE